MPNRNPLTVSIDTALKSFMQQAGERVEGKLSALLPVASTQPHRLHAAMRYSALDGGKRIRPLLVYAAGNALGCTLASLDPAACAVELIHAYSLVHDDLPAMDDDKLRRGKPTCHVHYDESTAILVGDALQSLAFQVLSDNHSDDVPASARLKMIQILARASGSRGMAGGQALDIDGVGSEMNLPELENMHIHKTGALIRASVQLGALTAQASPSRSKQLDHYAKAVGLAFQVQDDILDISQDTATLGKTAGKDQAAKKPTYPKLLGLEGAREKARELLDEALDSLIDFDEKADHLRQLAHFIIGRNS